MLTILLWIIALSLIAVTWRFWLALLAVCLGLALCAGFLMAIYALVIYGQ